MKLSRATRQSPNPEDVKAFWDANPLSIAAVAHDPGSPEFFAAYDRLRETNEPVAFATELHEYDQFAGKRVLEVGCGNAYSLAHYARQGALTHGIDISNTAIDISRKRFALTGLAGDFRVGSAEALPFPDDHFDCICSMGVLHHVSDTGRAVAEIHRCLKPGGRLIVMFYHRNSVLYRIWFMMYGLRHLKSRRTLVNEVDGIGNPKGEVYSRAELTTLLRDFGELEMSVGLHQRWMLPYIYDVLPRTTNDWIARRWGWFLYGKGIKVPPRDRGEANR